jgi:hypothetical protein
MVRNILTALFAGAILVAFAMPLPMLALSGSALAQKQNTSTERAIPVKPKKIEQPRTTQQPATGDSTAKTNVKSSKSNTSF